MEGLELYFLRHATRQPLSIQARFPHAGSEPYLLDPWTGDVHPAAQWETVGDEVRMELALPPFGSCLIAFATDQDLTGFARPGRSASPHVTRGDLPVSRSNGDLVACVSRPGKYRFAFGDGSERCIEVLQNAPPALEIGGWRLDVGLRDYMGSVRRLTLDLGRLQDWREVPDLKFCSERGVYTASVKLEAAYLQEGLKITLDLGRVHDAAVVEINGQALPPLLAYPFAADVTSCLRPGENEIRVTVIPTLRNGLIGFARSGGKHWKQFKSVKEFAPSGLIGPVRLAPEWRLVVGNG
jgi:hypothetical protein